MQWNSDAWLWELGRTTLMVAVSAVIVAGLLSLLRVRSTALRRAAWMIVPLQGWLAVQIPIVVERSAAPTAEPVAVAMVTHASSEIPAPNPVPANSEVVGPSGVAAPVADPRQNVVAASPLIARTAPESPGRAIPWTGLLLLAWSVGALVTMAFGAYRYRAFLRLLRSTEPATGDWQDEFQQARAALGIETPVELRISDDAGPCLVRRLRGSCIVAPRGLWIDLTPRQRIAILRHELAHLVRGDLWKSIGMRLLSLPQWFNPAAWWAVRRFDECAEWACDELAAGDGDGATEYSKLLLALGAAPEGRAAYLPAAHRGCVATRIRRLVAEPRHDFRVARVMIPLVAAGLVAINLLRIDVVAQMPEQQAARSPAADLPTRLPWHPDELVAVLGEERGSLWTNARQILVTRDGGRLIADGGHSSLFIYDADSLAVIGTFGERRTRLLSAALSQNGSRLIAGYADGTMTVWNIESDEPVLEQTVNVMPPGLEDAYLSYSFALDADRIVISTAHKPVMLWELAPDRLKPVLSFEADGDVYRAAISPDGQQIVTNFTILPGDPIPPDRIVEVNGVSEIRADCCLQLWDVSARRPKELDRLTTGNIQFLSYLPDGQTLIGNTRPTETPSVVRCVKVVEGELAEQPDVQADFGFPLLPTFSPDRRRMAIPAVRGGLHLVDLSQSDWPVIATIDTWATSFGVAFTADGDSLYLGVRSCLERWDRNQSGEYVRVSPQPVHSSVVHDLLFRPDGESIVSVGGETICEWNLRHIDAPEPIVHELGLAAGASPELEWWDTRDGALCLLTDRDQKQSIRLLDGTSRNVSETFDISFGSDYRDRAWCLDIHPDGKLLATGHWDHAIRFWDLEGNAPARTAEFETAHRGHVCDIAFSPDGTMLASVGWDHAVKLWDTSTDPPSVGGELGQHEEIVRTVTFSRDSRWLASGDEAGVIRLWDLKSPDLSGPTVRHPADLPVNDYLEQRTVNTLQFSADATRLLAADGAGRVTVWSVPSGEIIKEWQFPGWVWVARWSPDEKLIATGNQNGTVYLLAAPE